MRRSRCAIPWATPTPWITGRTSPREIEDMGADSLCIKDMAGLLTPYAAAELVTALKEGTSLPIDLHTHYTSGVASMTYLKAVEAGCDIIDYRNVTVWHWEPASRLPRLWWRPSAARPTTPAMTRTCWRRSQTTSSPMREEALKERPAESRRCWA